MSRVRNFLRKGVFHIPMSSNNKLICTQFFYWCNAPAHKRVQVENDRATMCSIFEMFCTQLIFVMKTTFVTSLDARTLICRNSLFHTHTQMHKDTPTVKRTARGESGWPSDCSHPGVRKFNNRAAQSCLMSRLGT